MNNKILKNYYILKSKWMPNDTLNTFKPFVLNLIKTKKLNQVTIEEISNEYYLKYGYRIEMFLLRPVLNTLKQDGVACLENGKWSFNANQITQNGLDSEAEFFTSRYRELVDGFVKYCDSPAEVTFSCAEKTINDFVESNNIDPKTYNGSTSFNTTQNEYAYFLSEYLKQLLNTNKELFEFFVSLCEAFLIKSYVFNEGLNESAFTDKVLYIDTPIIFKLLGYYDVYYQKEYLFLINNLLRHNCKIYIFKRNYDEVVNVLQNAETYVESIDYDYSKASDVCNYFRLKEYTAEQIGEEIEMLKKNLSDLGIEILESSSDWADSKYIESYENIKQTIIDEYKSSREGYLPVGAINVDTDSTIEIYSLRRDNQIRTLADAHYFYISSNCGFVNAIRKYNSDAYPNTISPVISDSFVGLIISGENASKANKVAQNRVLSFCYSAFKPTQTMKERFLVLLNEEKDCNRLTENDYIALRNHPMVNEFLIRSTRNSIEELNVNTIYEVLDMVKADHIADAQKNFDSKIETIKSQHVSEINALTAENESKINKLKEEKYSENLENARIDYSVYCKKTKRIFAIVLAVLCSTISGLTIWRSVISRNNESKIETIITGILAGVSIIGLIADFIAYYKNIETKFLSKILLKKKKKIAQKYKVNIEDF